MSNFENNERNLVKMSTRVSNYQKDALHRISNERKLPMSRLIAYAVDNELLKDNPFQFETKLSEIAIMDIDLDEFAEEARRIYNYMKLLSYETGLDVLLLLRHEMGISDKEIFLIAFNIALESNLIETFQPRPKRNAPPRPADYLYYRAVGSDSIGKLKISKNIKDYRKYLQLKTKFENGEELN